MDDQMIPTNPPNRPQKQPAEPPQSSWLPPAQQPPTYQPNQAQPPYPQYPSAAPPSQPMNPYYGQSGPSSFGPPNYGQPGYAAPSQPLYPVGGQPPQAPQRRPKTWQWVLIGVGGFLVLCCVFSSLVNALSGSRTANVAATDTPSATDTPAPTATPQPTATPLPPGVGDHMAIGHDYGQDANGFYITRPADTFSSRDEFAYVVNLDQGIGTTQFKLIFVQEQAGGTESVVYSENNDVSDPTFNQFSNEFPIRDVLGGYPAGKYKVEVETDSAVLASEAFNYTG